MMPGFHDEFVWRGDLISESRVEQELWLGHLKPWDQMSGQHVIFISGLKPQGHWWMDLGY